MGELQVDQLRRYVEIKQSDMPSAVAAKKTKEFRSVVYLWFCSKLMDQQDKCIFQVPSEGPDEHDPGVQEPRGGGVGGARVLGRPPLQDVQLSRPNHEGCQLRYTQYGLEGTREEFIIL